MKNLNLLSSLILFSVFILFSCGKDKTIENKPDGNIKFGFSPGDALKNKLKSSAANDSVTSFVISVNRKEDNKGIYEKKKIELFNFNGSYISGPVSLTVGDYYLTEFDVMDASNNIIYYTPQKGDSNAYLVNFPLPIEFNIKKDSVNKLVLEVVCRHHASTSGQMFYGIGHKDGNLIFLSLDMDGNETIIGTLSGITVFSGPWTGFDAKNQRFLIAGGNEPEVNSIQIVDITNGHIVKTVKPNYMNAVFSELNPLDNKFYGIGQKDGNSIFLSVDMDGNETIIGTLSGITVFSGAWTAFDTKNQRFLIAGGNEPDVNLIQIVDITNGHIVKTVKPTYMNAAYSELNPLDNKFYGIGQKDGNSIFLSLDMDGNETIIGALTGITVFSGGWKAFDTKNQRFLFAGGNESDVNLIQIVDITNGHIVKTLKPTYMNVVYSALSN
jgi:hypothetical protein